MTVTAEILCKQIIVLSLCCILNAGSDTCELHYTQSVLHAFTSTCNGVMTS